MCGCAHHEPLPCMWSPLALTLTEGASARRARAPGTSPAGMSLCLRPGPETAVLLWRGKGGRAVARTRRVSALRARKTFAALVCNARGGSDQPCALALALVSHASHIECSPTPPRRAVQVRASVNQKLEESGEKEKLKELLRKKLIERGWRDELKEYCKEVIKSKGLEQISVEDLVSEITPRGRATIPDDIKADLLERIRKFLASN